MSDAVRNAKILRTELGYRDGAGSSPTAWVTLDYGGTIQGFGGYRLRGAATHDFIYGVLSALKAPSWEALPGTPCRARLHDGMVVAIGHYLEDAWFEPGAGLPARPPTPPPSHEEI